MLTQISTVLGEAIVVCELLLGAVLILAWVAIEVLGYCGLAIAILRNQRWLTLASTPKPARDIKWGATVRAAGLRRVRVAQCHCQRRSLAHASNRSSGQQFTIRSGGTPARRACAIAVSAYCSSAVECASLSSANVHPSATAARATS
jgi:hypothetical protein